jgi:UDP-N-acetyl-D-mannosaminuronate dehydrogenase
LGVVYKDNTNSYKNSPTLGLLKYLKKVNNFYVYDRYINKIENFSVKLITNSLKDALQNSDVIFIISPLKEFNKLNTAYLKKNAKM